MRFLLDTNVVIYFLGGRLKQTLPEGELVARDFLNEIIRYLFTDIVRDRTILLRKQFRLKIPDALITATALEAGAILLTNDQRLMRVPSIITQAVELQ